MTKKKILFISFIGVLLIFSQFFFDSNTCGSNKLCNDIGDILNQDNLTLIYIMPLVLFFSLITYKMREEIFRAWWGFAVWFVPIIIIVTFLQNIEHQQSGFAGVAQGAFETFILIILYAVFIIVSVARIIITVRKIKKQSSN